MKTNNLLPNKHKLTGWIIFIIGLISTLILSLFPEFEGFIKVPVVSIYHDGFMSSENDGFFKLVENDITGELAALFLIIGGLIVGFTKEKVEDEFIAKLRSDSLVWSVILNYCILIIAIMFVFDFTFMNILFYNMFTPLLFYIFRFNYLKLKSANHEE